MWNLAAAESKGETRGKISWCDSNQLIQTITMQIRQTSWQMKRHLKNPFLWKNWMTINVSKSRRFSKVFSRSPNSSIGLGNIRVTTRMWDRTLVQRAKPMTVWIHMIGSSLSAQTVYSLNSVIRLSGLVERMHISKFRFSVEQLILRHLNWNWIKLAISLRLGER